MTFLRRLAWTVLALALLISLVPGVFALHPAERQFRDYPYAPPGVHGGTFFPLGTDEFGRDVYSRICYGASASLLLAPAAVIFSLALALLLGMTAGARPGWTDTIVTRAGEVFLALPWFYFVVALRAALPLHLSPRAAALTLFALLGGLGWAVPARVFRAITRRLMAEDFVLAAQALGAGRGRILFVHVLPGLWPAARAQLLLSLPAFILTEVNLSFLGLGITGSTPSLGNLLTPLQQYNVLTSYPWMFAPAVVIVAVFLALQAVAD